MSFSLLFVLQQWCRQATARIQGVETAGFQPSRI